MTKLPIEVWVERLAGPLESLPMDGAGFRERDRLVHGKLDDLLHPVSLRQGDI